MTQKNQSAEKIDTEIVSHSIESFTKFFSITYAIILTLSVSYNIGYFKYINPQIVDLMTLNDYITDSVHNIWFFIIAILLFFSSSLAFVRKKISGELGPTIVFGSFVFIASAYCFFKGINHSKFWPTIRILIGTNSLPIFVVVSCVAVIFVCFFVYRFAVHVIKRLIPVYVTSILTIAIFMLLILMPYLGGMTEGYIESNYLTKEDYKLHLVNLFIDDERVIPDVFILKHLEKGIIIRKFNEVTPPHLSKYEFINLGNTKRISYQNVQAHKSDKLDQK